MERIRHCTLWDKYEGEVPANEFNNSIKEGITEVFESYPELTNIGTQEQYSQYLDTIFPDSEVKDILWHSTVDIFDKYSKSKTKSASKDLGYSLNLSLIKGSWDHYARKKSARQRFKNWAIFLDP